MRLAFSCCCFARADLDASLGDGGEHNGAVLPLRDLVAPCAPSPPHHPHLSPVPSTSAVLLSPGCSYCMRSAGWWLHSASAALRHCGFQPHCRLSACSARWRGSRYRLRCAHQRRRSACRALTAQRGRVPGGLASPRASWSMRSRSGQASRRRRPSWCSVQVQPACTARVACTPRHRACRARAPGLSAPRSIAKHASRPAPRERRGSRTSVHGSAGRHC